MGNYEDMTNLNQLKGGDMAHPWEAGFYKWRYPKMDGTDMYL